MVQVTVREVSRTGEIIDIAVKNGANQVSSVGFSLSPEKEKSLRATVLTQAVANARSDADVTAAHTPCFFFFFFFPTLAPAASPLEKPHLSQPD